MAETKPMVYPKGSLIHGTDLYLSQIHRIPVLSRAEEKRLALRWFHHRDREAGQQLVVSNLRFVVKIAREYTKYGHRLGDLIQEGNLGLLHSLDRFDPRKGFRFISYAVWWVRAYIQAYILRSWSIVRLGTTRLQRRVFSGLQKARRKIAALGGEEPQNRQLAKVLDVSEKDLVATVQRIQQRDLSLEAPVASDSTVLVGETIPDPHFTPEENVIALDLDERVRGKLSQMDGKLNDRERFLLQNRLMSDSPVTLEQAGAKFGVTRERVRQIEERLKQKLRVVLAPAVAGASL